MDANVKSETMPSMKDVLNKLYNSSPLVVCCTNYVTVQTVADIILAVGASPVMCEDTGELASWVPAANAFMINIGTTSRAAAFREACTLFKQGGKPVVLDPVGSGSVIQRTILSKQLAAMSDIIKGNASEIMSLTSIEGDVAKQGGKGVASMHSTEQAVPYAKKVAIENNCTVVVSGKHDFCVDQHGNQKIIAIDVPLMTTVVGTGCALTAVIAAFRAVVPNSFEASVLAVEYYNTCAQIALQHANDRPATFKAHFIDTLYKHKYQI